MTIAEFRAKFPEFASDTTYPDESVQFYLDLADTLLSITAWRGLREFGIALYTAHNLALDRQSFLSSQAGGAPGVNLGILSSKAVGAVSASYDNTAGMDELAASWNLTSYGKRIWNLIRIVGMGGTQL